MVSPTAGADGDDVKFAEGPAGGPINTLWVIEADNPRSFVTVSVTV